MHLKIQNCLTRHGLRYRAACILVHLFLHPATTSSRLAQLLLVSPACVSDHITRLERDGYLMNMRFTDKRRINLVLTPKGRNAAYDLHTLLACSPTA